MYTTMPSYHYKKSNPNIVFILGGNEEYHPIKYKKQLDYIVVDIYTGTNTNTNTNTNITISKIKSNKFQFINKIIIFIKTIFMF
jgi:hypothetical protein